MARSTDELVFEAARRLGLDISADDRARLADKVEVAGVPGGPYPDAVPDHLADLYDGRDLSQDSHRAAYVGLLSTVSYPHRELPVQVYEQILEPEGWLPYADARDVVTELEGLGISVGLISNVGFDLRPILRAHGFEQLASCCTLSYELGCTKPDPRIFEVALDSLGSEPEATLMVGDHPDDRGAEALGIRTLILPMSAPGSEHGLRDVL